MLASEKPEGNPAIVVGAVDHERLTGLATALASRLPDVADDLLAELERATVVPAESLPDNVVQMGSTVTFRSEGSDERTVKLVFPAEADIALGRISIATPVGVALLGLEAGQGFSWTARNGRIQHLKVISVEPPTGEEPAA